MIFLYITKIFLKSLITSKIYANSVDVALNSAYVSALLSHCAYFACALLHVVVVGIINAYEHAKKKTEKCIGEKEMKTTKKCKHRVAKAKRRQCA